MRIAFAGTPEFAVPTLRALVEAGHDVVSVWTQPDRPAGRGRKVQFSPVKICALEHELAVHQPDHLKGGAAVEQLTNDKVDLLVVVAFGMILPQKVIDIPTHGCWNLHASLLPRWRGAAPIQRAIEAGDVDTGSCVMQMEAGLDTGPVLARHSLPIGGLNAQQLHDCLATSGAALLVATLKRLAAGETIDSQKQDDSLATYARKLSKAEAPLDYSRSAIELERQVRAFNPWPVSTAALGDMTVRVFSAQCIDHLGNAKPGTVVAKSKLGVDVACGEGALRLLEVQRAGGRRITGGDLANQLNA